MPEAGEVTRLEHYKRVCAMMDTLTKRMDDTFRLFVQVSTVVVGGFIWLKMQPTAHTVAHLFPVARWIIPLLALVTIVQMYIDLQSWHGYRRKEPELNAGAPAVSVSRAGKLEYVRMVTAGIAAICAYWWLR
jgi:hypothetical protein